MKNCSVYTAYNYALLFTETTVTARDNTSAVTGLSAVLGIILFSVTLAVCILLISLVKRKLHESSHKTTIQGVYAAFAVYILAI